MVVPDTWMTSPTRLLFAQSHQNLASHPSSERCVNEHGLKRRRLGSTSDQDGTVDSQCQDATELKIKELMDELTRLQEESHREAALNDHVQTWESPSNFSTSSFGLPESDISENDHDLSFRIFGRGRTPERDEQTRFPPPSHPASRANSVSSVRSMIDERLEWAHQDRMRSASRDGSVPMSPFHEHSQFYAEFARDASQMPQSSGRYMYVCECCPKKPKRFDTEDELREHESTKIYSCAYCPNRFKNANEAERHQNSLHLRRHSWSCASLTGPDDAIAKISDDLYVCGYCGEEFRRHDDSQLTDHVNHVHKFNECNRAKKFFRADHFRQHLKHSHAATSGKWTNVLENACIKDEPLPEKLRAVAVSVDATQASFALQSATSSMTRLSIPDAQDTIPPPLPPPKSISEISNIANSGGHLANHSDAADFGDSAALSPHRRLSCEGQTSPGLPLGLSKRHFLRLVHDGSGGNITRKRRMSSPLSDSAKEGGWTSPATPACNQTAVVESSTTEDCTKSPASLQRPVSAAEERRAESLHVCSTCQRGFARRTILVNHERTHTGEKPFFCTFEGCSQTFAQQGDKTRHEQAQHTEKTFICGGSQDEGPSWGCGKKFRRKDGLLEHHSKTKKGKQCVANRDKLVELGGLSNEDSVTFS